MIHVEVPAFFCFKFSTSKAASSATFSDFKLKEEDDVDTGRLLPVSEMEYVVIRLRLYTESQLMKVEQNVHEAQSTIKEAANLIPNLTLPASDKVLSQVQKELQEV